MSNALDGVSLGSVTQGQVVVHKSPSDSVKAETQQKPAQETKVTISAEAKAKLAEESKGGSGSVGEFDLKGGQITPMNGGGTIPPDEEKKLPPGAP